jgi:hypothetical protein
MATVFRMNSAICYISVKLTFGIVWVQKDAAKIITSVLVKVRISKEPGFVFSISNHLTQTTTL